MSKIDEDALADAYNYALDLEKSGQFDAAAEAYRKVLELDPDDHGGAIVRLAAMEKAQTPDKAPDAYVATLFDQHAEVFDSILVDQLGYAVPMLVRQLLPRFSEASFPRMLDLGCGTGLTGQTMADMTDHITGVDLSEGMLNEAYEREVYDDLYAGEAVKFLQETDDETWDLITATDVLPYMGQLTDFFDYAAKRLNTGGLLAFSSETCSEDSFNSADFKVTAKHRFAHQEHYIRHLMDANHLSSLHSEVIVVRTDEGEPIYGHLMVARKV